ncbi:MAG: chromate efflux transporter [Candidatus Limnocylindrales bacterium]
MITARGSVREVLGAALRLGLTSFGGPIAHVGYFRREYVTRRGWLDEHAFGELVALCQLLPGPASSELGIAIGTLRAGRLGGLAAWVGFTLPSAIVLTAFALLTTGTDLSSAGWVEGLKLAAVAVVGQAVWSMGRTLAPDLPRAAMAVVAAVIMLLAPTPLLQVVVIVGGGAIGWRFLRGGGDHRPVAEPRPTGRRVSILCLSAFGLLLLALPLARAATGDQTIAVIDAFYRAGGLVFGGGHVVLPLLHAAVVPPGWISDGRFVAGYGAAQAVPGPLFTFAAYLGAALGPAPNGVPGAVIALGAIFLPAFLLIWGALPLLDLLRRSASFTAATRGTNAVVVGILGAALITPIGTAALHTPLEAGLAATGFLVLSTGRVPPIVLVAAAAAVGQALALA